MITNLLTGITHTTVPQNLLTPQSVSESWMKIQQLLFVPLNKIAWFLRISVNLGVSENLIMEERDQDMKTETNFSHTHML